MYLVLVDGRSEECLAETLSLILYYKTRQYAVIYLIQTRENNLKKKKTGKIT